MFDAVRDKHGKIDWEQTIEKSGLFASYSDFPYSETVELLGAAYDAGMIEGMAVCRGGKERRG